MRPGRALKERKKERRKEGKKKLKRCDMSHICPDHPRCATRTKVVMCDGVPDIVNNAKFRQNRLRLRSQNLQFSCAWRYGLYYTLRLPPNLWFAQCKTSIGNNSGSTKHRAIKFACIAWSFWLWQIEWCNRHLCHVSIITTRNAIKCKQPRVVGIRLDNNLVVLWQYVHRR